MRWRLYGGEGKDLAAVTRRRLVVSGPGQKGRTSTPDYRCVLADDAERISIGCQLWR